MRISRIEIENYKSFFRLQTFTLEPGVNLLLGTNNAGKSAVLELLALHVLNGAEGPRANRSATSSVLTPPADLGVASRQFAQRTKELELTRPVR